MSSPVDWYYGKRERIFGVRYECCLFGQHLDLVAFRLKESTSEEMDCGSIKTGFLLFRRLRQLFKGKRDTAEIGQINFWK